MMEKLKHFLAFKAGKYLFAIDANYVLSINEPSSYEEFAYQVPQYMLGILNSNDDKLPLLDFSQKLGFEEVMYSPNNCVLIIEFWDVKKFKIAFLVDSVQEVQRFEIDKLVSSEDFKYVNSKFCGEYYDIQIIDLKKLFKTEELGFIEQAVEMNKLEILW